MMVAASIQEATTTTFDAVFLGISSFLQAKIKGIVKALRNPKGLCEFMFWIE
jgi:hypothetical protein